MRITKSDYLIGRQCLRRLWLIKHSSEPTIETEDIWQMRELEGALVEQLAGSLYASPERIPECLDNDEAAFIPLDADASIKRTLDARKKKSPILQAYLQAGKLLAISDILEPREGGWYLWEVKASTDMYAIFDFDLAFQVEVARRSGLDIVGAGIWLVNKDYVRDGDLEPDKLLVPLDRTDTVFGMIDKTKVEIDEQLRVIRAKKVPDARPCLQCKGSRKAKAGNRPSTCGQLTKNGFCGKNLPQYWIGQLPNLSKSKEDLLSKLNISSIEEIDLNNEQITWTESQHRIIQAVQRNVPFVNPEAIRNRLDELEWPIAYVDFEFDPGMAVPRFNGTHPYTRIPFQWSMAIQMTEGADLKEPKPFLWLEPSDPRKAFLDSLLAAIPETGSIVVHSRIAESTVLHQLGQELGGDYATRTKALKSRIFDTIDPLKEGYYHPMQYGSYSIKRVAPALVKRGYEGLKIQDGMTAVVKWKKAISVDATIQDKEEIDAQLKEYCRQDTVLMHDIIEFLRELI